MTDNPEGEKKTIKKTSKYSRRFLLGRAGATAALAAVSPALLGCSDKVPRETEAGTSPPETPTPEPNVTPLSTETPTPHIESLGSIDFLVDQDRIPLAYFTPDGKKVMIDQVKLEAARKKAIANNELEIFDIIKVYNNPLSETPRFSKEHPVLKELPADVLSTQELEERGVAIIQADNTTLYIRSGAFAEDGPLALYSKKNLQLQIVLIDGIFVSKIFMDDPKYDPVRSLAYGPLDQYGQEIVDFEKYRQQQIRQLQYLLAHERQKLSNYKNEDKPSNVQNDFFLIYKSQLYQYEHMSKEELALDASVKNSDVWAGFYESRLNDKDKAYVFLAIGKNKIPPEYITLCCDSNGQFSAQQFIDHTGLLSSIEPKANQSFPSPIDFKRNLKASPEEPDSYPYSGQTTGQALRHEIKHDDNRLKFYREDGSFDQEAFSKAQQMTMGEYGTDEAAMEEIRKAWERWVNSGYKDDSGYCFVFSLPGKAGYILTSGTITNSQSKAA